MKWISFKDQRPEGCCMILLTDGKSVQAGKLHKRLNAYEFETLDDSYSFDPQYATHWMTIEELPR